MCIQSIIYIHFRFWYVVCCNVRRLCLIHLRLILMHIILCNVRFDPVPGAPLPCISICSIYPYSTSTPLGTTGLYDFSCGQISK